MPAVTTQTAIGRFYTALLDAAEAHLVDVDVFDAQIAASRSGRPVLLFTETARLGEQEPDNLAGTQRIESYATRWILNVMDASTTGRLDSLRGRAEAIIDTLADVIEADQTLTGEVQGSYLEVVNYTQVVSDATAEKGAEIEYEGNIIWQAVV